MGSRPKAPKPTPEQLAIEKRTAFDLEKEARATERMLKIQSRGKLGAKSLLRGIKPVAGLASKVKP
jgi:hypothetical protein